MLSLIKFFSCNARFLHTRMKNCISHHDESMLHARVSLQDLNPEKVLSSRLRLSSRNSFKIVTRIVHTKSWCYLICPMAEYTPDNVADKHWPIELALLSVVISFHNFSLIGWKICMVATKSREQWYILCETQTILNVVDVVSSFPTSERSTWENSIFVQGRCIFV